MADLCFLPNRYSIDNSDGMEDFLTEVIFYYFCVYSLIVCAVVVVVYSELWWLFT